MNEHPTACCKLDFLKQNNTHFVRVSINERVLTSYLLACKCKHTVSPTIVFKSKHLYAILRDDASGLNTFSPSASATRGDFLLALHEWKIHKSGARVSRITARALDLQNADHDYIQRGNTQGGGDKIRCGRDNDNNQK